MLTKYHYNSFIVYTILDNHDSKIFLSFEFPHIMNTMCSELLRGLSAFSKLVGHTLATASMKYHMEGYFSDHSEKTYHGICIVKEYNFHNLATT